MEMASNTTVYGLELHRYGLKNECGPPASNRRAEHFAEVGVGIYERSTLGCGQHRSNKRRITGLQKKYMHQVRLKDNWSLGFRRNDLAQPVAYLLLGVEISIYIYATLPGWEHIALVQPAPLVN